MYLSKPLNLRRFEGKIACERRRISGCRLSPLVFGGDKRQPEIRLRSQAKGKMANFDNV